ncbi:hypothetical protein RN001_000634 [Aquatica leii]|uniref:Uncharacterized protein n=1 Tax=Aquatica leii TaxID=1421715 RepID=A0AAN7PFL0_9COLE|nr:hypothetical protein RN001_000634 [Aquatica leii]
MSEHSSESENGSIAEDLIHKDTDSFKCLAQIYVSRSSIFRNPLYPFPPLSDPGLSDAIDYTEPPEVLDNVGVNTYIKLCKKFKICPFTRILKSLSNESLNLKYYGLNDKQMEAVMEALSHNTIVLNITLEDNYLTPKSVEHLSNMLFANRNLKTLVLKECRLGPEGAAVLNDCISSTSLIELDLSHNGLDDAGLNELRDGLSYNKSIRILNLSNNNLGEGAADALKEIITSTELICDLDLSWNNFYSGPGNTILFNALMNNTTIKTLKISWNAIATKDATKPIMKYLKATEDLEYLDISGNRLTGEALTNVRSGLSKCINLQCLKIGNNLLKPDEALSIIKSLLNSLKNITEIYINNTFVTKDCLPFIAQAKKRNVKVEIEGVLGNFVIKPPDQISLLFERAKFLGMKAKSKKAQIDFGKFVVSLPEEDLMPADFQKALVKFKLKLDPDLVQALITKFPAPKGKFSCVDMRKAFLRYYPDTYVPPPKETQKPETVEELPQAIPNMLFVDESYSEEEDNEEDGYEGEEYAL